MAALPYSSPPTFLPPSPSRPQYSPSPVPSSHLGYGPYSTSPDRGHDRDRDRAPARTAAHRLTSTRFETPADRIHRAAGYERGHGREYSSSGLERLASLSGMPGLAVTALGTPRQYSDRDRDRDRGYTGNDDAQRESGYGIAISDGLPGGQRREGYPGVQGRDRGYSGIGDGVTPASGRERGYSSVAEGAIPTIGRDRGYSNVTEGITPAPGRERGYSSVAEGITPAPGRERSYLEGITPAHGRDNAYSEGVTPAPDRFRDYAYHGEGITPAPGRDRGYSNVTESITPLPSGLASAFATVAAPPPRREYREEEMGIIRVGFREEKEDLLEDPAEFHRRMGLKYRLAKRLSFGERVEEERDRAELPRVLLGGETPEEDIVFNNPLAALRSGGQIGRLGTPIHPVKGANPALNKPKPVSDNSVQTEGHSVHVPDGYEAVLVPKGSKNVEVPEGFEAVIVPRGCTPVMVPSGVDPWYMESIKGLIGSVAAESAAVDDEERLKIWVRAVERESKARGLRYADVVLGGVHEEVYAGLDHILGTPSEEDARGLEPKSDEQVPVRIQPQPQPLAQVQTKTQPQTEVRVQATQHVKEQAQAQVQAEASTEQRTEPAPVEMPAEAIEQEAQALPLPQNEEEQRRVAKEKRRKERKSAKGKQRALEPAPPQQEQQQEKPVPQSSLKGNSNLNPKPNPDPEVVSEIDLHQEDNEQSRSHEPDPKADFDEIIKQEPSRRRENKGKEKDKDLPEPPSRVDTPSNLLQTKIGSNGMPLIEAYKKFQFGFAKMLSEL